MGVNLPNPTGFRREVADCRAAARKCFDLWAACCTNVSRTAHPSTPAVFGIYPGTLSHLRRPWALSRPPIFSGSRHRRDLAVGASIRFPFAFGGLGSPKQQSSKGKTRWQNLSSSRLCWPASRSWQRVKATPTWRMPQSGQAQAQASRRSPGPISARPSLSALQPVRFRTTRATPSTDQKFGRVTGQARCMAGPSELIAPVALVVPDRQEGPRARPMGERGRDRGCSRSC